LAFLFFLREDGDPDLPKEFRDVVYENFLNTIDKNNSLPPWKKIYAMHLIPRVIFIFSTIFCMYICGFYDFDGGKKKQRQVYLNEINTSYIRVTRPHTLGKSTISIKGLVSAKSFQALRVGDCPRKRGGIGICFFRGV
jgi:hypothetical protein